MSKRSQTIWRIKGFSFFRRFFNGEDGGVGSMLLDPDGHPLYFVNIPGNERRD